MRMKELCNRSLLERTDVRNRIIALSPSPIMFVLGFFAIAYGAEMFVQWQSGSTPTLEFYVTSYGIDGNTALQGGFAFILICVAGNLINVVMEDGVFRGLFMRVLGSRYPFIVQWKKRNTSKRKERTA